MSQRSLRPTRTRVAFEEARPIFEAGKNDEIEPEDFHLTQLLTTQFKEGMHEIVKEIDRLGLPPQSAWVHLMGPCIERPTVLRKILLNHETGKSSSFSSLPFFIVSGYCLLHSEENNIFKDLAHFRRPRERDRRRPTGRDTRSPTERERQRYKRTTHMWEFPSYVRENARPLQEVTLMRYEDCVNVATCRARLAQSGGDGLIYLMKLLTKVARDLLDPDELMPAYNIYSELTSDIAAWYQYLILCTVQRISGECIFILPQPDRVILSVTRGLQLAVENMMVWVCGTFRTRNEDDICYSRVSHSPSAVFRLTDLQPLSHTNTEPIYLLTRFWFPRDIIFAKCDFVASHRAITMSCKELLRHEVELVRYSIPNGDGVILLGRYMALIPTYIDHESNIITWRCELRLRNMSEDTFKEVLIDTLKSGEWASERATRVRRYLARRTDQAIRATTAVVFVGRRRARGPLPPPAVIH